MRCQGTTEPHRHFRAVYRTCSGGYRAAHAQEFAIGRVRLRGMKRGTDLVERLGAAGCDDALVGIGRVGHLSLEFTRQAVMELADPSPISRRLRVSGLV